MLAVLAIMFAPGAAAGQYPVHQTGPPRHVTFRGAVTTSAKVSRTAPDDAQRAGFEILWRETTNPRWWVFGFAKVPGRFVFKGVSTDNHYFAVRSVGKNGARSTAVPAVLRRR